MPSPSNAPRLSPVTVGPIVGVTTATSVRLWGRGNRRDKPKTKPPELLWCQGYARVRKLAGTWSVPQSFKMLPHFDFTGTTDFAGLSPATAYEYELGYLHFDGQGGPAPVDVDWAKASSGSFTTSPDPPAPVSFVFGSCRYLLPLFGGLIFDNRGDKAFESISKLKTKQAVDFLLMVGDQIYADPLRFVNSATAFDEYTQTYRNAFSQQHIRGLMASTPTYMMLDDHEIEDNWTMDRLPAKGPLYAVAMQAFHSYQLVHGPAFAGTTPTKHWYTFAAGCAQVFVMDTRTERWIDVQPTQIISIEQMSGLKAWLRGRQASDVKLIVTSVPLFPDSKVRSTDRWSGFERQRNEILDFIRDEKVPRVVFLSGDVHCSMIAELACSTDPNFRVRSVISSPFYWFLPHMRGEMFTRDGILTESRGSIYTVNAVGNAIPDDNFVHVGVTPSNMQVSFYNRKGGSPSAQHTLPFP